MLQVGVRQLNCRCAGTCDNGDDPEQDRGRLKERGQVLYINGNGMPPELQCKFSEGVRLLTNCTCKVRSRKNKRPAQLVLDLVYISTTSGNQRLGQGKRDRERKATEFTLPGAVHNRGGERLLKNHCVVVLRIGT